MGQGDEPRPLRPGVMVNPGLDASSQTAPDGWRIDRRATCGGGLSAGLIDPPGGLSNAIATVSASGAQSQRRKNAALARTDACESACWQQGFWSPPFSPAPRMPRTE